jgi:predicted ester cyclase
MTIPAAVRTDPVSLARHAFDDLLNRRDVGVLVDFWAEDVVEEFPFGTLTGRAAVVDYFASTFAAFPDFRIEARQIAGDGDTVFVRWHVTGTFSGAPWMGIEPTGSRVALDGMDCFTFRGAQVAHNVVIFDQLSFARQIGLLPGAGTALDRALTAAFNTRTRVRARFRR